MTFTTTINAIDLLDYLPDGMQPRDIEVVVDASYEKAVPDVGIMRDYMTYDGFRLIDPNDEAYAPAVEEYMNNSGQDLVERWMADYEDYLRD